MAFELTVTIIDGKATVMADGTPKSCALATELEKSLGKTTKLTPGKHAPVTQEVRQS